LFKFIFNLFKFIQDDLHFLEGFFRFSGCPSELEQEHGQHHGYDHGRYSQE